MHVDAAARYAEEAFRVGALMVGARSMSAWRPRDARLRAIVEAAEVVALSHGSPDIGIVVDALREVDPHFAWSPLLHSALALFDRAADSMGRAERLATASLLVDGAVARCGDAWDRLASASDDLDRALDLAAKTAALIAREVDRGV